jgi:alkanesulfonate monooxygenase SsuD/methylene tetrahydromethanopterin reductase-like flavin-dependent oxidoreductase (luciferase family)
MAVESVKFGIHIANFGEFGNAATLVELGQDAENAGWDGFFLWDHILWSVATAQLVADPWLVLAAIAARTDRLRLGPLVTPIPRRRPWKLAREVASLDIISGGRAVFGAGLGYPPHDEFEVFGETVDIRTRADQLDEGLTIIDSLLRGEPVHHSGAHYTVNGPTFLPAALQTPRVPVWLGATWPNRRPFRRAARWDGIVPERADGELLSPDDLYEVLAYVQNERGNLLGYDVAFGGYTPAEPSGKGLETVAAYREAGMTWWMERIHPWRGPLEDMRERIRRGPPRE